jgi:hypothetical protein
MKEVGADVLAESRDAIWLPSVAERVYIAMERIDATKPMAKTPKETESEYPDAWERFERAVKVVAKSPPQHRTKKDQSPVKGSPKRAEHKKPASR